MSQPSPTTTAEQVSQGDLDRMIDEARKLPGVTETIALMEAISGLVPPPPTQFIVTRYATGGNVPDANMG